MIRFYGLSYSEIKSLPVPAFEELWAAIDVLEAQEYLLKVDLSLLPNSKDAYRRKRINEKEKIAYPKNVYSRKSSSVSVGALDKALNRGGA